ncbi:MAG: NAD-dependent succinate-semialdehyde dehydrogenase [Flavobacteriales bacterium]|nr:NAD-dependent succinate-semialdehyde dehydrogenase [Flavobacteriales bacterium]
MHFKSINPYNGEVLGGFPKQTEEELTRLLHHGRKAFEDWRLTSIAERIGYVEMLAQTVRSQLDTLARTITLEMGKTLKESKAEIEKCAWLCDYYAEHAEGFLKDQKIQTDATESYVRYDPLGGVFAIMPWNYPFWQVFRFAIPALMAGNTAVLKHAPNVFGCAKEIASLFAVAGFPDGAFLSLTVDVDQVPGIIADRYIQGVTLTGSGQAGASVAATAGSHIKKTVLELGGSNAFVVLADANLDHAVDLAVRSRMQNAGQSCIAAKRIIVVREIYEVFQEKLVRSVSNLKTGDPLDDSVDMGPLARTDLAEKLEDQVMLSVKSGAEVLCGGIRRGAFYKPTVLNKVQPGMPVFDEETFGPVAPLVMAQDEQDAYRLAAMSEYGLGITICTQDIERVRSRIHLIDQGAVFVNELVKSDPRLPFGGVGKSGYGRELGEEGIRSFVNRKTVYIA